MKVNYAIGLGKPDAQHKKYKKVYDACMEAGIDSIPDEVMEYFNGMEPNDKYRLIELPEDAITVTEDEIIGQLIDIDLSLIPEDVKKIRFVED